MRLQVYCTQIGFGTQSVNLSVCLLPSCNCIHLLLNICSSVLSGFSAAKSQCQLHSSFAGVEDVLLQSPHFTTLLLAFEVVILVSLADGLGIDFWDWFLAFSAAIVCSAENMFDGMQWFCNPVWVSLARKLANKSKMADVWKM